MFAARLGFFGSQIGDRPVVTATGATRFNSGDYTIIQWTGNGTLNVSGNSINLEYLLIGKGGNGALSTSLGNTGISGGGGGGGQVVYGTTLLAVSNNDVKINAGPGGNITLSPFGFAYKGEDAITGGNGANSYDGTYTGGTASSRSAGGGAGNGANGSNAPSSSQGGDGGQGTINPIVGSTLGQLDSGNRYIAGGGGGGAITGGTGGLGKGGGGDGGVGSTPAIDATDGTGGGGGGAGNASTTGTLILEGANGAVAIRFLR